MLSVLGTELTSLICRRLGEIAARLFDESGELGSKIAKRNEAISQRVGKMAVSPLPVFFYHVACCKVLIWRRNRLRRTEYALALRGYEALVALIYFRSGEARPAQALFSQELIRLNEIHRGPAISIGADTISIAPEERELQELIEALRSATEAISADER